MPELTYALTCLFFVIIVVVMAALWIQAATRPQRIEDKMLSRLQQATQEQISNQSQLFKTTMESTVTRMVADSETAGKRENLQASLMQTVVGKNNVMMLKTIELILLAQQQAKGSIDSVAMSRAIEDGIQRLSDPSPDGNSTGQHRRQRQTQNPVTGVPR